MQVAPTPAVPSPHPTTPPPRPPEPELPPPSLSPPPPAKHTYTRAQLLHLKEMLPPSTSHHIIRAAAKQPSFFFNPGLLNRQHIPLKKRGVSNGDVTYDTTADGIPRVTFSQKRPEEILTGHYLGVRKWEPDFRAPEAQEIATARVWVRLPGLPIEYCNEEALGIIAKKFGKPIRIDITIDVETRARSARVCVEIELGKPLCHGFRLERGGDEYRVEYESTHSFCFNCGRVNHLKENCRSDSTGYSSLAIALVLPESGRLVACETDAVCVEVAKRYYGRAGVSHKVILEVLGNMLVSHNLAVTQFCYCTLP
ncbi:hypothetical protein RHMOL_Rhmol10G0106000 [Rhododendron molle]|uniref:Uncharacterized protein n=1 Tax=Rhododendron molle TaxID=49168 RepID=A0ACC0M228_RHOML|nr:hypothetical protein RHMOL_Rhmol10G0106000 [Rhododendron molle]